ncbi:Exportin-5 [Halotydeus destructor]|nr:Exportin-5 [Halotydeus destructor]
MGDFVINGVFQQITKAIEASLSPVSSAGERAEAATFVGNLLGDIAHASELLQVSFQLIELNSTLESCGNPLTPNFIRFGFQILENVIRQGWNSLTDDQKQALKVKVEQWVLCDTFTEKYLKDSLSRCVIEVIYREWPQNWPNMLPNYLNSAKNQTVLYTLWRLSEDVGLFFKPSNPTRRREILHELNTRTPEIMLYIGSCLQGADVNLSVIALRTLTGFLEWSAIDPSLVTFLCNVLGFEGNTSQLDEAKLISLECLLICLTRKGLKDSDKKSLSVLFSAEAFVPLSRFTSFVLERTESKSFSNSEFVLTKQLCQVLSASGQFILNASSYNEVHADIFVQFIQLMHKFFIHHNLLFCSLTLPFWKDLLKHSQAKASFLNSALIEHLITALPTKFDKQANSEMNTAFEFDAKEDYDVFFVKFRANLLEFLRDLALVDEQTCFRCVVSMLDSAINSNASATEWEILSCFLDAVCNKLKHHDKYTQQGERALALLMTLSPVDYMIASYQLSCISAFSVFLPYTSSNLLQSLLQKIFSYYSILPEGSHKNEIKNLRRHAGSCLIKFSKSYPTLFLPYFSEIHQRILPLSDYLSQSEKCVINESLFLISNHFTVVSEQANFFASVLEEARNTLSLDVSPLKFVEHIGLCRSSEHYDEHSSHRTAIIYVVNTLLGLLKRSPRKEVLLPLCLPFIGFMTTLCSTLNSIWKEDIQRTCHDHYRAVFEPVTELDKVQLLEAPPATSSSCMNNSLPPHRMQSYLWALHESAFSVLGLSISVLSPEVLDTASINLIGAFEGAEYLPSLKLKMILKNLAKPLILKCTSDVSYCQKLLNPVLSFLVLAFRKANTRWDAVKERLQSLEEEHVNNQEVLDRELLEDHVNRALSKEFIDLWMLMLVEQVDHSKLSMVGDDEMKEISEQTENTPSAHITNAGNVLLHANLETVIFPSVVSLTWLDSGINHKSCLLNIVLLGKLFNDNVFKTKDEVGFYLRHVITALNYFGEHDQNQSRLLKLALILYEGISKLGMEDAKQAFHEASGSSVHQWKGFEDRLIKPGLSEARTKVPEKKKKDALRLLMDPVIGKSLGQLHAQNKDEIKNLQPFLFRRRKGFDVADSSLNSQDVGLCRLFDH